MNPSGRFEALDAWRGVAATMVVAYHFSFLSHFHQISFLASGYLLVDFFFVLSGFVIAHAYAGRLRTPVAALGFMVRRFGRLWPLHAAMLALFVVGEGANHLFFALSGQADAFRPSTNDNTPYSILTNLLLIQAFGLHNSLTWNGASWSISAEFYAYAAFCAVFLALRRAWALAAAALALLGGAVVFRHSAHVPLMDAHFDLGFFRCLFGFFVGVLTHGAYAARRASGRGLANAGFWELAAIAGAVAFMAALGQTDASILAPLVFAPAVFIYAFEGGTVSRLLRLRPFMALGAWSYSIYMTQAFVARSVERLVKFADHAFAGIGLQKAAIGEHVVLTTQSPNSLFLMDGLDCLVLAAVLLASWATYSWIETPGRRYFNRLAGRIEAGQTRAAVLAQGAA